MHVVHVVDYFHPKLGYQESALALEHRRLGHRVTVVTSDRQFPFPNYDRVYRPLLGPRVAGPGEEEHDGLRILRLRARLDVAGFVFVPGITRALRALQPDVVIHHGLLHPNFFSTALAARRAAWPLVADSHMADYNTSLRTPSARLYLAAYRALLGRFVRRRARAVAIGPSERDLLRRVLPGVEPVLVPLGADAGLFAPDEAARRAARTELGFAPGDRVLVHAGKFQPDKKTLEVVAAFKTLAPRHPGLRLLLVGGGSGDYLRQVSAAVAGQSGVVLRDFAAHDELPRLLRAADAGVWPGSPSVVFLEAMALGLPLVLGPGDYSAFLLRDGNGVTAEEGAGLAAALEGLLDDPSALPGMAVKSRALFEREFRWDRIAQRFLDLAAEPPH